MALYSDRAHWAFHTPTAKGPVDKKRLTQVGLALARLGIDLRTGVAGDKSCCEKGESGEGGPSRGREEIHGRSVRGFGEGGKAILRRAS